MSAFASPAARASLSAWYPRFLSRIQAKTEERTVPTRVGETHVLVGGPADAPPLVVFHGALATSAHIVGEIQPLLSRFRIYAADIPGHSPMSADARIPMGGYGAWAVDLLDGLGLKTADLCGVSYGGFVAISLLSAAPARIRRASLVVPAGLVSGSAWVGVTRLALPMAMYRWFPTEARLRAFTAPMFTEWDDDWGYWLGEAIRGFNINFSAPPLASPEQLAGFRGPVQVFGASDDVHFPGPPLLARAKAVFANVVDTELLECRHAPPFTDAFRERLSSRIAGFLDQNDVV